ncbi:dolichol phosphate-mannose biosynthesis regulatory protein Dpm2 [Trametes versicolor FP-101664 SS1]|uniref:dolichol phosphate-mannose biosynthesis regulatory protein Dpm2 n=1 Tax=Trametes versicolor (strain FP-101664) TaxID=717944 RepID=UPI0004623621|nr:dolichol phosphate-mannose biosynthesis regulatory protein Dpm2 [Trametes versicolor FP-101664 SS1]EIW59982.1 dolichol phosphate-mannose biosynthesis regulatory protein Dpm2 [Trametes versicolor FP-101664 SS1]
MLLLAASTFLYYTIWTLLLPILDESSPVHAWFPSREWALRIPAFIVVLGISAIGLFLGARIIHDSHEEKRLDSRRKVQ